MPGVDIAAILATVGQMLLQALMNALTNTLTNLMTQAITGAIEGLSNTLEQLFGVNSWLSNAIDTFAHNLEAELSSTVATLTNGVNQVAQQAMGIIDAQQRLHEQLTGVVEGTLQSLRDALGVEAERQEKTGAAFTELLLRRLSRGGESLESLGRKLFEMTQDLVSGDAISKEQAINQATQWVMGYILADLKVVEDMPQEDMELVADYLNTLLQGRTRELWEWFRDTVVEPVSYANAFMHMLREGLVFEKDDVKEHLRTVAEAHEEFALEYLEKLERKAAEQGLVPR